MDWQAIYDELEGEPLNVPAVVVLNGRFYEVSDCQWNEYDDAQTLILNIDD